MIGKFVSATLSWEDIFSHLKSRIAIKTVTLFMAIRKLLWQAFQKRYSQVYRQGRILQKAQTEHFLLEMRCTRSVSHTLEIYAITNMNINLLHHRNKGEEVSIVTAKSFWILMTVLGEIAELQGLWSLSWDSQRNPVWSGSTLIWPRCRLGEKTVLGNQNTYSA